MKNHRLSMLLIILALLLASLSICGCVPGPNGTSDGTCRCYCFCPESGQTPQPGAVPGEAGPGQSKPVEQMNLTIVAAENVNFENDNPHPVSVCIYQFANPGAFTQRQKSAEGLEELLSCQPMDSSVLSYERVSVHPGAKITKELTRMQGAYYLGMVASYFDTTKGDTVLLVKFDNTAGVLYLKKHDISLTKTGITGK